jgi:hypothetical protein
MIIQSMAGYVKWHSLYTRGSENIADIFYKISRLDLFIIMEILNISKHVQRPRGGIQTGRSESFVTEDPENGDIDDPWNIDNFWPIDTTGGPRFYQL